MRMCQCISTRQQRVVTIARDFVVALPCGRATPTESRYNLQHGLRNTLSGLVGYPREPTNRKNDATQALLSIFGCIPHESVFVVRRDGLDT